MSKLSDLSQHNVLILEVVIFLLIFVENEQNLNILHDIDYFKMHENKIVLKLKLLAYHNITRLSFVIKSYQ